MSKPTPQIACPRFLPAATREAWAELDRPEREDQPTFDPDRLEGLPAATRRWLRHAIAAGTPLRSSARIAMHGEIRIGRWVPFRAVQILGPDGFIWAADAGRGPLRVRGFDYLVSGAGEMRWRLFGRIPVVSAAGGDIARSAAGRHAGELLAFVPGAALAPTIAWRSLDEDRAIATVTAGAFSHELTIDVDSNGALRTLQLQRWGNPGGGAFQEHTFGVEFQNERVSAGYTIPTSFRAGWWFGSEGWADGEFFRCTVDRVEFF